MAGEELSELVIGVEAVRLQDLDRSHDEARRAEAALDSGLFNERLLDVAQLAVGPQQADDLSRLQVQGPIRLSSVRMCLPSAQTAR